MSRAHRRIVPGAPVRTIVNVRLDVMDVRSGRLRRRIQAHNRAVDVGLTMLRDHIYGDTVATVSHCAVGSDGTAPAAGDTALGTEVLRGELLQRTKGTASLTLTFLVGSQQANGETLREWGLLTAASGGLLYARVTPEEVVKTIAVQVLCTWTLSWAADV